MRYARLIVVAVATLLTVSSAPWAEDNKDRIPFRRGIGISHVMGWAPLSPSLSHGYDLGAFVARAASLSDDELLSLRRTGFDFVRLAVDPGPFLQTQGAPRDELDQVLKDRVTRILSVDLSVIVDFHPGDQNEDYGTRALTVGSQTPKFQAYLTLLARTARLLDNIQSRRVALEIMNEPELAAAAWQPMLDAAYAAIRRAAPDLLVVLDGGLDGQPQGMMGLQTSLFENDPAAIFTFHYYDPYQFTHQGAAWNAARYLADVPYPALARPIEDSIRASAELIDTTDLSSAQKWAAKSDAEIRLQSYRRSEFGRENVVSLFNEIGRWAQDHHIPPQRILLGEFGARKTASQDDGGHAIERANWFRDVRTAAELHQFSWAAWAYRGPGGFGLFGDASLTAPEPAVIDALGLAITHNGALTPIVRPASWAQSQGLRP
jgi:endoglucanase